MTADYLQPFIRGTADPFPGISAVLFYAINSEEAAKGKLCRCNTAYRSGVFFQIPPSVRV